MQFRASKLSAMVSALALVIGATTLASVQAHAADEAAEKTRRAQAAAHIGSHVITVGDLEDRLARVPRYQLTTFGPDAPSIRKKFLEDIVARDILFSVGAESKHIDQQRTVQQAMARARAEATKRAVRLQAENASITPAEVQSYYDSHIDLYAAPERYGVWRIFCKTREEAVAVLAAAKQKPTPENFGELARVHSIDQATNLRNGNLGFLGPDGASNEAGLHTDPAIVKAAAAVKDGELVPTPVQETEAGTTGFAVVWHRGTVGASKRTLDQVGVQIRDTISKTRGEDAVKNLLVDLRARLVTDENDALLKAIDISQSDGAIVPRKRSGQVPALKSSF